MSRKIDPGRVVDDFVKLFPCCRITECITVQDTSIKTSLHFVGVLIVYVIILTYISYLCVMRVKGEIGRS